MTDIPKPAMLADIEEQFDRLAVMDGKARLHGFSFMALIATSLMTLRFTNMLHMNNLVSTLLVISLLVSSGAAGLLVAIWKVTAFPLREAYMEALNDFVRYHGEEVVKLIDVDARPSLVADCHVVSEAQRTGMTVHVPYLLERLTIGDHDTE